MDTQSSTHLPRVANRVTTTLSTLPVPVSVLGIVAAFAAFAWLVAVSPALVSFALAVVAAVAWSLASAVRS